MLVVMAQCAVTQGIETQVSETQWPEDPSGIQQEIEYPSLDDRPTTQIGSTSPFENASFDADTSGVDVPLPSVQFTVTHLPKFGSKGFGANSLELRQSYLLGYGELPPLTITPGAAIHFWTGPTDLDLPPRVYDAFVDLQWNLWKTEKSSLVLGATPGLYGDYKLVDHRTFQWSGWFVGSRHLTENWTVLGGVAYLRQLRSNWLPLGGAIWTPNSSTRFELLFPRPRLSRLWVSNGKWNGWGYLGGQFGGGAWSVADTSETNVSVGYSDLRLIGGYETISNTGLECRAELGYVFARELTVNDTAVFSPSGTMVAQISFAF